MTFTTHDTPPAGDHRTFDLRTAARGLRTGLPITLALIVLAWLACASFGPVGQ